MKKIALVGLTIILIAAAGFSMSPERDRDVVLTDQGTLYEIESVLSTSVPDPPANVGKVLLLKIVRVDGNESVVVPATRTAGSHENPALNYDRASQTLFVFWQHRLHSTLSSQVVFCTYHNGEWSRATTLDTRPWDLRENLRIGVTRRVEQIDADGKKTIVPELTVHAVWWHTHGRDEYARYAMLTVEKGNVTSISLHDMSEFIVDRTPYLYDPRFNRDLLRYPMVHESPTGETIDVVYGDFRSNSMHRTRIKPSVKGRLRIPIGVRDVAFEPPMGRVVANSIDAVFSDSSRLAFYGTTDEGVKYILFDGNTWSDVRTIRRTGTLSGDEALQLLRKMVGIE